MAHVKRRLMILCCFLLCISCSTNKPTATIAMNGNGKFPVLAAVEQMIVSGTVDTEGNIYLTGTLNEYGPPPDGEDHSGVTLLKFDSLGTLQWQRTFDREDSNQAIYEMAVVCDSKGWIYVGSIHYPPPPFSDLTPTFLRISQFDPSGHPGWNWTSSIELFLDGQHVSGLAVDGNGNLYGVASFRNQADYLIVSHNEAGQLRFERTVHVPQGPRRVDSISGKSQGGLFIAFAGGIVEDLDELGLPLAEMDLSAYRTHFAQDGIFTVSGSPHGFSFQKYDFSGMPQWKISPILNLSLNSMGPLATDKNDNLYFATNSGKSEDQESHLEVFEFDSATGKILWKQTNSSPPLALVPSAILIDPLQSQVSVAGNIVTDSKYPPFRLSFLTQFHKIGQETR